MFGDEVSAARFAFKNHFQLVQRLNVANGIQHWEDIAYCAMMFRLHLTGPRSMGESGRDSR